MTEWRKNPGYLPPDLAGTNARVYVRLRNGREPALPWDADGRQGVSWGGHRFVSDFDVVEFRKD